MSSCLKVIEDCPRTLGTIDKYAAAKREAKKKETFSAKMLLLNAIEKADSKCFCLLGTGANALVLPRRDTIYIWLRRCYA